LRGERSMAANPRDLGNIGETSDEFEIRSMTLDDIDAVTRIERESYEFPWTPGIFRDCLRAGYVCKVGVSDDNIVGYGLMSFGAGECHILNLCVSSQQRRMGNASAILDYLVNEARKIGVQTAFLEVRESNQGARVLYEDFGFCETGVRPGYYPHRNGKEDALIFSMNVI